MKTTLRSAMLTLTALALLGLGAHHVHADSHDMADDGSMNVVSGDLWGNSGGAHLTWDLDLPSAGSINLNYSPCYAPHAVQLNAFGADGAHTQAMWSGPCSKELMLDEGGSVLLQLSNYLHGTQVNWELVSSDYDLPGGGTRSMAMDDGAMMDEGDEAMADDDGMMADEGMADDDAMADDADADMAGEDADMEDDGDDAEMADDGEAMAEDTAPAMASAGDDAMSGTLLGNSGGAFTSFEMPVEAGETYTLRMTRGMDVGGNWPGVGFKVWGPGGLVAASSASHGEPAMATFTATMDGTYQVQVHNYHHGRTLFYAFDMPSNDAM